MRTDPDELLGRPPVVLLTVIGELLATARLGSLRLLAGPRELGVRLAFRLDPPVGTEGHAAALLQELLDSGCRHWLGQGPRAECFEYLGPHERGHTERRRSTARYQQVPQRCDLGLYALCAAPSLGLPMLSVGGLLLALAPGDVPVPRPSATLRLALLDHLRLLLPAPSFGPVPDQPTRLTAHQHSPAPPQAPTGKH
ncbi:hypothetical protein [Streptomyces sp. Mg1]|uniref:hypothetical protein n=1 Tax=Streptomyces sp. Mg1 TaxID=465541 RepID=UPI003B63C0B0